MNTLPLALSSPSFGGRIVLLFSFLLCTSIANSFNVTCNVLGALPPQVPECSGIDYYNASRIWIHNDAHANDHYIYGIDSTGTLTKTINITNATNIDWEDITHDAGYNFMYIGDFGNNNYDRTDLKIYRVAYSSLLTSTTATADVINFSYPDQTAFPSLWKNFDMEAFFHHNGMLYLFSKNSGNAVGYTKLYSLPDQPGTYVATLIDSFYTNNRISAGDINPSGTAIAIMSNAHIHIFQNWAGNNFFSGSHTIVDVNGTTTQKEGLAFVNDNFVYMTDEKDTNISNYLYSADLSQWIPSTTGIISAVQSPMLNIFPNPCNEKLNFAVDGNKNKTFVELINSSGEKNLEKVIDETVSSFSIETAELPIGIYFLRLLDSDNFIESKKVVITH